MDEHLKNLVELYSKIDWNRLLRKDLGEHNLEPAKKYLDNIKKLFDPIVKFHNLDEIPMGSPEEIKTYLNHYLGLCAKIINFRDIAGKDALIQEIHSSLFTYISKLKNITEYIQVINPPKDENTEEAWKQIQQRRKDVEEDVKKAEENIEKTARLLTNTQKKVVGNEISQYGNYFGKEAKKNEKKAKLNFRLMSASILGTLTLAIGFLLFHPEESGVNFSFYLFISKALIKFVIISLGFYFIAHFSKIHSAEQHLYNINTQKQNALESHQQILQSVIHTESENEKEIRNAILLELTRAIFTPKDTGYSKTSNQISSPANQIIEISKSIPR